jgi:hypothetical protein
LPRDHLIGLIYLPKPENNSHVPIRTAAPAKSNKSPLHTRAYYNRAALISQVVTLRCCDKKKVA